ncbi:MAG TPA: hypothetical protein VFS83_03405 [Ktedonobacterales bacterium]|nr:hypothetical protein [Ktedonobacterales bacterium]
MSDTSNLARKLGLAPGCSILLLDAPTPTAALLRDVCPPGVTVAEVDDGADRYDLIFLWLRAADGLAERFGALQWRIMPDGAIWAMLLKKSVALTRGVTLTWEQMQTAALQTDLVDNKIASVSDEEYGTRFVIRRERRSMYTTPPSNR